MNRNSKPHYSEEQCLAIELLFKRLVAWERAPEVLDFFMHYHLRPIVFSRSKLQNRIYRSLCYALLEWTENVCSPGAEYREWADLFRLLSATDPLYIRPEQIESTLEGMDASWHHTVVETITNVFILNNEKFPSNFPSPLLTSFDTERWTSCFPQKWKLASLNVLQSSGLFPPVSLAACHLICRFVNGELYHSNDGIFPNAELFSIGRDVLVKSKELPPYIQKFLRDSQYSTVASHFLLASFTGNFNSGNVKGPCQHNPICHDCYLQEHCCWRQKNTQHASRDANALFSSAQEHQLPLNKLLETVLNIGREQANILAKTLPENGLKSLVELPPEELRKWCKTLDVPTANMRALLEICRRFETQLIPPNSTIKTAWDIFKHFQARFRTLKQEQFFVVMLDKKRRFIGECLITQGTLDASPIHPREVFNPAIKYNAHSIIVIHNHPSGDPKPSEADISVTKGLIKSGNTLGIPLQDHVIIGQDHYASLMELGFFE